MTGNCSDVGPIVDTILVNWAFHCPWSDASLLFVLDAMSDRRDGVDWVDICDDNVLVVFWGVIARINDALDAYCEAISLLVA